VAANSFGSADEQVVFGSVVIAAFPGVTTKRVI
jgi:hypothetical protein